LIANKFYIFHLNPRSGYLTPILRTKGGRPFGILLGNNLIFKIKMAEFEFKIIGKDKNTAARRGIIHTFHGEIETPYLVPVATLAAVRSLDSADLEMLGAQCALINTYHLHLKPGDKLIKKLGGAHKFMNFKRPLFSDSGGFQAFSLGLGREHNIGKIGNFFPGESVKTGTIKDISKLPKENLTKISDNGIEFRSIYDGSWHFWMLKNQWQSKAIWGQTLLWRLMNALRRCQIKIILLRQ